MIWTPVGDRPLGRQGKRWKNVTMNLKEILWGMGYGWNWLRIVYNSWLLFWPWINLQVLLAGSY